MRSQKARVFCIGWHKTGTSTLGMALIELGYSVVGARLDLEMSLRNSDVGPALEMADRYDAVQDIPWCVLFRELDERYPGARFVFTDREDENWLRSAAGHFGEADVSMHEWLYGAGRCVGNEDLYLQRFRRHRTEVFDWFRDRPNDLLVMNVETGDGWNELCSFLSLPVPQKPWPHANKGEHSLTARERVVGQVRKLVPIRIRRAVMSVRVALRRRKGLPDPRDPFHNRDPNKMARNKKV